MVGGGIAIFYKAGTRVGYKGGTSTSYKDGTGADYKGRTPLVCSLLFFYLFSLYMYHTHLKNIQIFAILTFTKFFRFRV
jgi:hypothetical protein